MGWDWKKNGRKEEIDWEEWEGREGEEIGRKGRERNDRSEEEENGRREEGNDCLGRRRGGEEEWKIGQGRKRRWD